jgi:putative DNA primase/helicase
MPYHRREKQAGKRLWIAEGYATALTVHHLTGETVMVALSSVNLLSLASLARQKHPACQIVLAADRDLNGDGQTKPLRPQKPVRALLPCRRCSVTGMMRLCRKARRPRGKRFMTPSGHRLKALSHHERGGIYRHERQ